MVKRVQPAIIQRLIDFRATWQHESAEERGVVPGYPFKSLEFLSKGLPGEKVPKCVNIALRTSLYIGILIFSLLVSRTFVIEAVLTASDATFDPSSMQSNKLTPVSRDVPLSK